MISNSIENLILELHNGDPKRQYQALLEVQRNHVSQVVSDIVFLLDSNNASVRAVAAETLGTIGDEKIEEVGPKLVTLLLDSDDFVRVQAAEAFGQLPLYPPAVVPLMERLLDQEEDGLVRVCAAETLGYLGDTRAIPALLSVLQNEEEDELVCSYAAISVGFLGDANLIPTLHKLMEQEFWERVKAALLLSCIRLGDEASIPKLLQLMETANEDVVGATCRELAFLLEYQPTAFFKEHAEQMRLLLEKLQAISHSFVEPTKSDDSSFT